MSLVVPVVRFDEIPNNHVLRELLRIPFIALFRKEFEKMLEKGGRPKFIHTEIRFGTQYHNYIIEYRRKFFGDEDYTEYDNYKEDDKFIISERTLEGKDSLGYMIIRGGIMRTPIKPNEVEFHFSDLIEEGYFTVGSSRRKQQLNRNRSTVALMAATRPNTAEKVGLTQPLDPHIAAACIAPMLGADGTVITAAANAEADRVHAEVAEEKRLERMRTVLEGYDRKRTRKSRKRTRRTRRH